MSMRPIDLATRFWSKVLKTDGCWLWMGARHPQGYGNIGLPKDENGRYPIGKAHRVSWELHNGPIPAGLLVMHRCDNPPCVNPDHLFVGTVGDNVRDSASKGRLRPGGRTMLVARTTR